MINHDEIGDQGLSPEFASMLLVVLIGGYTLVGGLGVINTIIRVFQMPSQFNNNQAKPSGGSAILLLRLCQAGL